MILDVYKDFNITNYRCVLSLRDPLDKEKYYPEVLINFSSDGTGITLHKSPTPVLKDDPRYALITTDI